MVTIPLGLNTYDRIEVGKPEIELQNRYVEKDAANLREKISLIGRPGAASLVQVTDTPNRGNVFKPGLFQDDLFIFSGASLFRYNSAGVLTQITGTIAGSGFPYATWMKGIGYEYLFIADGTNFWYFSEHANGILTLSGGAISTQVIQIGGIYYSWSATVDPGTTPDGTSAKPYLALLGTGLSADADSLSNMAALINFSGTSGLTYSSSVPGANASVTATPLESTLSVTAIVNTLAGNAIATTIFSGSFLTWTGTTLTGGAGTALRAVTGYGPGETIKALTSVSSYVLASVADTQKFYWINPGDVTIDPLNFAEKESNPDNILDMLTVGDQGLLMGNGSTENWYATGDFTAPFAPVEGRVYQRGVVEGTPVVVGDSTFLVGNNGIVYEIGYSYGTEATWGVHRVSTNSIEERIRRQLRYEQGLTP
jgi:hypothetical protein